MRAYLQHAYGARNRLAHVRYHDSACRSGHAGYACYRHHGMDANAIIDAAEGLTAGAPVRHRKMAV
jgi:hypothetical protein